LLIVSVDPEMAMMVVLEGIPGATTFAPRIGVPVKLIVVPLVHVPIK